ncbi:hypothetical protein AJ80_03420 [Polytolypa hystricis UAMH7299]|uniref:C2H2-type domain-containing protein n=1 Tax=Polytolypa hystricis (strain UAMH7299) TaxID=1447883 RepID=A0A2B7YIE3_POLH7|nr:hypothetical protein AJ80_03420 [Polytolypa hystricis UAMH7299]
MSQQFDDGSFCLECHWDSFKDTGRTQLLPSNCMDFASCWDASGLEHCSSHQECPVTDPCCDIDDCSVNCSSVCDGFIDCDAASECSQSQCDEVACDDIVCDDVVCDDVVCDDVACESAVEVCFDKNCIEDIQENTLSNMENVLGQDATFNWNSEDLMHSANSTDFQHFHSHHNMGVHTSSCSHSMASFFPTAPSQHIPHCNFERHGHDTMNQSHSNQNNFSNQMLEDMLGMCATFVDCSPQSHFGSGFQNYNPDDLLGFIPLLPHGHPQHQCQHQHNPPKLSIETQNNHISRSPSLAPRSSAETTPSLAYSRLKSTPLASPLLKDTELSSPFTTPGYTSTDETHICKWVHKEKISNTVCGAIFSNAGELQDHLIEAHVCTMDGGRGHGYYCCWDRCHRPNEPFSQKSKLQGHFLTHSNYKSFQCSVCGKPFARQATLERHERSHRGEKPYKCKLCGKSFTDSSELKTHTRTHTGEKPFKCSHPGCNFETGDSSNMSSHKLTHGVRRHKCPFPDCSKSFTRPDQLKRHLKTTHKDDMPTSPLIAQLPLP